MQQSQQQALSNLVAQQALLQEAQKHQPPSVQQRSPAQQPRMSQHILTNPYLNPYSFQLFYNNSMLAQAQIQAAALAASGGRSVPMAIPWLKVAQQGAFDKELQQQQALYAAALYGQKAFDGISDYSALFRSEHPSNSASSPAPPNASPRRENPEFFKNEQRLRVDSPKEILAKKLSHSPSPLRTGEFPINLQSFKQHPSPHREPSKCSPHVSPIMEKDAELQKMEVTRMRNPDQEKDDSWKAKYYNRHQSKAEGELVERGRASKDFVDKTAKSWSVEPQLSRAITHTPLGMIDPATFLAAHGAHFMKDDAIRQNGLLEKCHTSQSVDPQASHLPFTISTPSIAHSFKTWQPPLQTSEAERKESASPKATNLSLQAPKISTPPPLSGPPVAPISSHNKAASVFNIDSLKYQPSTSASSSKRSSNSPKLDKNVIVKTSPLPGSNDRQSVKYISDKNPIAARQTQQSPSPERLGPIMADGSRARILPPESLRSLYRFPDPSSKSRPNQSNVHKRGTDSVIIKTGQYQVTEVHGARDSALSVQLPTSANHLVYQKHPPHTRGEIESPVPPCTAPSSSSINSCKPARKRAVEEEEKGLSKKVRSETPPREALQNRHEFASSSDPYLRGLVGAGVFDITGSKIIWGDSSKIGSEYPGAPTKVAIKDALLGRKKENGLNLSTDKSQPDPSPPVIPRVTPAAHPKKRAYTESPDIPLSSFPKVEIKEERPMDATPNDVNSSGKEPLLNEEIKESAPLFHTPMEASPLALPAAEVLTSSASNLAPTKLKKAWIKRSYETDDTSKQEVSNTSDNSPSVTESSPNQDRTESDSAVESIKKKKRHKVEKEKRNREIPKKKRKTKDKEAHKSKSECGSLDGSSQPKGEGKNRARSGKSNSKLYLQGKLPEEHEDLSEGEETEGKKEIPVQMPLGENGLPISVLLCKKEQTRLKKSGEAFVQDAACHEIASMNGVSIQSGGSSLPRCRECRSAKRKENNTIFCRFYGFRKLNFVNCHLQAAGFCDPEDSHVSDLSLWLPFRGNDTISTSRPVMELETCRYIMKHIGGKFCELVQDEREALLEAEKAERVRWKRPVHGVREMCDACETTLFNLHWVCQKCGFGICQDCYQTRSGMSKEDMEEYDSDRNNIYRWLKCGKGKYHLPSDLVPTQIIPSSCLFDLCELAHDVRAKWNITSQCRCKKTTTSSLLSSRANDPTPLLKNHCNSELLSQGGGKLTPSIKPPDLKHTLNREGPRTKGFDCENSASPLDWLASIALRDQRKNSTGSAPVISKPTSGDEKAVKVIEKPSLPGRGNAPLNNSSSAAPRSWLCNGQLLQLTDSSSSVNVDTFQLHWFYGMPVMASGASDNLNRELWKPERFSAEHGDQPTGSALINCRKGSIITNALIRDFWVGFEKIGSRLCDERTGEKLILKLKDWPTADDFIDTMPEKFDDLMRALPLPQYTARDGKFNMAAHLPDFFVRPDLGPKMYIAYGWVTEKDWSQGTTNLHLDISDACNLMVYVGVPEDEPPEAQETLISIIKEGDADDAQVERARSLKAGALWHIFKAADTDKIRKLILKVKAEKGIEVSDDHDPIHDQQIYLDKGLRQRLREEYGVEGYPLVQCEGDSVFIPAGAPHQVFNLHSCIKVAEDFVSPEHVDKCFKLTEEFRHLSTTHSNHEDKLQLKNIIFHTMKEVVAAFHTHELRIAADPDALRSKPSPASQT